jgi:hypothetical protein
MPSHIWSHEEALIQGARGRQALKEKWEKLRHASTLYSQVRRTKSSLQAIDAILASCYRDFAKLQKDSPAAERLSRTLLNLEQIRRIHSKGSKSSDAPAAVAQSGPTGVAGEEPSQVPDATPESDPGSSLPEMSPDL